MPPGSDGKYFIARIRGGDVAGVGSLPPGAPPMATWNTYIWVDSAEDAAVRAREAGGRVVSEPFDVMDAGRMAVLTDPEGAAFCVWQAKGHKGARVVNEHGSLNFNGLATRDPEGAAAFYGTVFGWKTLAMPAGVMWTLPGYGDHLEERSPGDRCMIPAAVTEFRLVFHRGSPWFAACAVRERAQPFEEDCHARRANPPRESPRSDPERQTASSQT